MTHRGGVDLGGTKILAVVVGDNHAIAGQARRPTPTEGGPRDVMRAIADTLREAAAAAKVEVSSLVGVGVGSPGAVDRATGEVSAARNLPGWEGTYGLGPALTKELGVDVTLGNDVQSAIRAEFAIGAGRPYTSLLGVWWGTGVGGGIVLDGKLWTGRGAAGEIGHTVVERDGAHCPCGRRGCLEAYAGRSAMEAKARRESEKGETTHLFSIMEKEGKPRLTSGVWARALEKRDPLAERLIARAIDALGTGIASAVNLLDVQAVVLGGGMGERLGEDHHGRLLDAMHPHLFVDTRPPDVHVTALAGNGGALGAAMLAG